MRKKVQKRCEEGSVGRERRKEVWERNCREERGKERKEKEVWKEERIGRKCGEGIVARGGRK